MPKKAKKNKGPDLSKMTEEERAAYLEQQALLEMEEKNKKEQMLRQFMENKLEKEEKFRRINETKFNNNWIQIMRELKSKDLKRDIEILSHSFERILDRKDSVIKNLIRNLNESEEQYNIALRNHADAIDKLHEIQQACLQRQESNFNHGLKKLETEFNTEEHCINENYEKQLDDLKNIFFSVDQYIETKKAEINLDFAERSDALKGRSLEDKHALRVELESKVNALWSEFREAQKRYNLMTEERKANFEILKAKDEHNSKEIDSQMKRISFLNEQIQSIKQNITSMSRDFEAKNKRLRQERDQIHGFVNTIKFKACDLREEQDKHLANLATNTDETIKVVGEM
ncbi:Dynein regulatory complex subunit 2 [Cichlidogyrus casuarinus]|uniref:Dynein regulatory complex subunit 2 n=1 Tax=Cichlidogyrus casuarinus TaxID=1844966 RepID=A0ABD2PZV8_9PLAT